MIRVKGYYRVATCVPSIRVADPAYNAECIKKQYAEAQRAGAKLVVFPEMSVTGYTCADLFHSCSLISAAEAAVQQLAGITSGNDAMLIVGSPVVVNGQLYNCAIAMADGAVVAIVPKTYLPNYNEFYERRWWQPAPDQDPFEIEYAGSACLFGSRQIISHCGAKIGIEICEDLWTPIPPSSHLCLAGAEIIANLSASDDLIGKYAYLRKLISQQSARCICGYAYSSAGYGESSTDLAFDGKAIIAENGSTLASNERWQKMPQMVMADIDLYAIRRDRLHLGSFADCASNNSLSVVTIKTKGEVDEQEDILRKIDPHPFVPPTDDVMAERCSEILSIQTVALAKRLEHIGCRTLVVGISGGLDSTLALLVAVRAYDWLGIDRKGIIGVTMPGLGTTARTKSNAISLMEELGVSMREIPIGNAVAQHFADIGQDPDKHDVTYENSQARERTQILMDVANKEGGIVLGTGDLSELALGWATYNGDHMSMYAVNAGVPKTLVKYLVRYFTTEEGYANCKGTLLDIIDTPISPELIPADKQGNITQKTEDLVGPYELHDFFLYYMLRYGFSPERIYGMAQWAFSGAYDDETIKKWLRTFYRRFFQQQFKRSCMPDGPKVGSVCLSPRGDWRMPSDASAALWLVEVESLK